MNFLRRPLLILFTALMLGNFRGMVLAPMIAHAQTEAQDGLEVVGDETGLGSEDPRIIVARIIRVFLTFLGVIAVVIVLYGGFTWMTAAGDEEKVLRAKKILLNGGIGLLIILMSWTITTFVISSLVNATGGNGGGGASGGGGSGGGGLGGGSSSAFEVTAFRPEGDVPLRNVVVRVTFSKTVDEETAATGVTIVDASGNDIPGTLKVSGNSITFTPNTECPEPNADRFCFAENTTFTVAVDDALKSASGKSLSCSTAHPCSLNFTTGSLIDTESPRAEVTLPDDGQALGVDSLNAVQVLGRDDAGISAADFAAGGVLFDTVPGELTDNPDEGITIESLWDTDGLTLGQTYRLTATVYDFAGNSDEDAVSVKLRAATCFNGIRDGEEEDIDCGGDTDSVNYCGACGGGSCTSDSDCGNGSCSNGACVALPVITDVSPANGAPGTYVTVSGNHFGSNPKVYFKTLTGETLAAVPSCADEGSATEIVVEVPVGAVSGSLRVDVGGGAGDATNDDRGELIPDFIVDTTVRPNLCSLSPSSGTTGEAVVLSGDGFGGSHGSSTVSFGAFANSSSYGSWNEGGITATVPAVTNGNYAVFVTVDGVSSNALLYRVSSTVTNTPSITAITPGSGAIGRYVTLSGASFGDDTGIIHVINEESGDEAVGSFDFPEACQAQDSWNDTSILFAIPREFTNGEQLPNGDYTISVEARSGAESNTVPFTVTAEDVAPNVCAITPSEGDRGDEVVIHGDRFGDARGVVTFSEGQVANVVSWSRDEATVIVPPLAESGSVSLETSSAISGNSAYFTVREGEGGSTSGAASYAWSFSTGVIPRVPQVITECSDDHVSAVPNARFTDAVCVNAVVYTEFTVPMNQGTLNSAVTLEKCTGSGTNPCSRTEAVSGTVSTTETSVTFIPAEVLATSATYRVTIADSATSLDGAPLTEDVSWSFETRADAASCDLERVLVSPYKATINVINGTQEFSALPVSGCVVTNAESYAWNWEVDNSFARLNTENASCAGGSTSCATVEALAEGVTPVTAEERGSGIDDSSELTINFTDPYITNVWPNCAEACVNASVGASFNTAMRRESVEQNGAVKLFACANELCTALTEVVDARAVCRGVSASGEEVCTSFTFSDVTLVPGTFYRAVVSGAIESESGVALTRLNYGGDYSWTFRAREDGTVCSVNRITVTPNEVTLESVGDTVPFVSDAYGAADSCSVSGQRLNGFEYSWSWENPIADEDIDNNESTRVASWYGDVLTDSAPMSVPNGCTESCVSGGSAPHAAVCGDGTLGRGEECEDGNVASGDGCSASCLREGANTYGTCGNNALERNGSGAGEDCDDGNLVSGDGCSSACLAEGSRAIGATCGNSDIAADARTKAGEECDEDNATSGDGCSSVCTNEGSPTLASIGGAVCGDGEVDAPAENCDDGNVLSGDGCSSACLLEGSSRSYASVCGDGTLGRGEECEDGNAVSGDGCSSVCLLEGSSARYASPSFCGDGRVGAGESAMCESGVAGDGMIDPEQVAIVVPDAVYEVDAERQSAIATIVTEEASSGLSAEATLTLMCVADDDMDCQNPDENGVGIGNCCLPRPTVTLSPDGGATVCRNAALYGVFSSPMDTSTFSYATNEAGASETSYRMYAKLDLSSVGGICPAGHTTLAQAPQNVFRRAMNALIRFVTGRIVNAATGDCVLPIEGYDQIPQDGGTYKVYLRYSKLLVPGGRYTLVVEGDDELADGEVSGVRSKLGVGLNGTVSATFTAGEEVCSLDSLEINDTNTKSPNVFTEGDEEHVFVASGVSYAGGQPVEIESIPGEYAWDVTGWKTSDTDLFVTTDAETDLASGVRTMNENGRASLVATATISTDKYDVSAGDTVEGVAPLSAFLCENTWPQLALFPWSDDEAGVANGLATADGGFMRFALSYCRDSGSAGQGDDLPGVSVVSPETPKTPNVLKEYLYEVGDDSSDAIGVRVISNPKYLSPMAWYQAQGFTGKPKETQVDGFAAVQDGRTTYVAAPNLTDNNMLYDNIYVISYNEGASDVTQNIYEQMLQSMTFALNVPDVGLCVAQDGITYTSTTCSSDLSCNASLGETCGSIKAEIRRDTKRLSDLTDIRSAITVYGNENGQCSLTTSQLCSSDSECPGTETCQPIVPPLSSGTYVRGLASSIWSSWEEVFGGALGSKELPMDPLNTYQSCGVDGSAYASYDAETCVDQTRGTYVCPANSYAYHYRVNGPTGAELYADLEYNGADWANPIDEDSEHNAVAITVGHTTGYIDGFETRAFCNGNVYGASSSCGDGVVGSGETCEIGQSVCDENGTQTCNSTCTAFVNNPNITCGTASCGDGIVGAGETCDDGDMNGRYGYCGATCTYDSAFFCGDGELSGGESCDCGSSAIMSSVSSSSRAYGAGAGTCIGFNGTYSASPNATCSFDCKAPAGYCGDGVINGGEQCDGTDATWSGKLCVGGRTAGKACSTNSDCGTLGVCGGSGVYAACPSGQTRVRACDDDAGATCRYTTSSWTATACTDIGSCGDGVVDPDEQCDDGNTDSTDGCTAQCTANVCGDGAIYAGVEECDEGLDNGQSCSSLYGASCTACSVSCRNVVSTGQFCGDGIQNGGEYCDGSDIPYTYFDAATDTTNGPCTVLESQLRVGSVTYTCKDLGICNGGAHNGEQCTYATQHSGADNAYCGGYACVKPTCNDSCTASCPFTYGNTGLLLTANKPGSRASTSVNLYSFDEDSTSDLPNAATLTVPACTAVGGFTATVDLSGVELPDVYVTFVLDRSGSMNQTLDSATGDSRMDVAKEVMAQAVSELYDELGDKVHIGLVGYADHSGMGLCTQDDVASCSSSSDCESTSRCSSLLGFIDEDDEATALGRIDQYVAAHNTQTDDGLRSAKTLLDGVAQVDNVRKIVVLLSDGDPSPTSAGGCGSGVTQGVCDTNSAAASLKNAGYEVYTVGLTTSSNLIANMKKWSSNSPGREYNRVNGIDYAYDGSTADALHEVYSAITDSIIGITVALVTTDGTDTYLSSASLREGADQDLPWPEGFVCDGVHEQQIPVQITFGGEGQIELSDVKFNYCAP